MTSSHASNDQSLQRQLDAALARVADLERQLARCCVTGRRRHRRAMRRNLKLSFFIVSGNLPWGRPCKTAADWRVIHADFCLAFPHLVLTSEPPGPLDSVSLAWVESHTVSARALRLSYERSEFGVAGSSRARKVSCA